jgi:hypothetical protein
VARAGVGTCWLRLPPDVETVARVRRALAPHPTVLTDAPPGLRDAISPQRGNEGLSRLERRVKARFDPAGALV